MCYSSLRRRALIGALLFLLRGRPSKGEQEHELVQRLAAGGDEEDVTTMLLILSSSVLKETK